MKRLLDESADELSRTLLRAGVSHRPGPGGKAKLMASLGVAGGASLWASKASAWFSTGLGKATLLSVVVGSGVAYLSSVPDEVPAGADDPGAPAVLADALPASSTPDGSGLPASAQPTPASASAPTAPEVGRARLEAPVAVGARGDAVALAAPAERRRNAGRRPLTPARGRQVAEVPRLTPSTAALAAASSSSPPSVTSPASTSRESSWPGIEEPTRPQVEGIVEAPDLGLLEEIRRVDGMRVSLRKGRRASFEWQVSSYLARFPNGQLRPEVDRMVAGLE